MEIYNSSEFSIEHYVKRNKAGKIKIKEAGSSQRIINITIIVLAVLTIYGFLSFDYKGIDIKSAVIQTLINLRTMFLKPKLMHFTLWQEPSIIIYPK